MMRARDDGSDRIGVSPTLDLEHDATDGLQVIEQSWWVVWFGRIPFGEREAIRRMPRTRLARSCLQGRLASPDRYPIYTQFPAEMTAKELTRASGYHSCRGMPLFANVTQCLCT
jgi:hypothetical protein